jgi:poly-gamma-glutamate capsule biosynthesis protein CapA/YwtB (metallophosphatase superfamily)
LEANLGDRAGTRYSVVAVGDIMLGSRARKVIKARGPDYPFEAVLPLLRRAAVVLANLEGPLARKARRMPRTFSYRARPKAAGYLARAGIGVVTLANNHLLDCGRAGVRETFRALRRAGVAYVGAGRNAAEAHVPVIREADGLRVGLLGYYWNRRTAATDSKPGSAMDPREALEADIRALRARVDRIVVTFHWGVPYVREPAPEDRAKARFAVDCGADAVIGHHPHIVQPLEVYYNRPIFYSVGNLILGSGNSRAEGMAVALRFRERGTDVDIFPLYVKNRDPRVTYQPKVLRLGSADRFLRRLAEMSGANGECLELDEGCGRMTLPWPGPEHPRGAEA